MSEDSLGTSLDMLLKLMAIVSMRIAPLPDGNEDCQSGYIGVCISGMGVFVIGALLYAIILLELTLRGSMMGRREDHHISWR